MSTTPPADPLSSHARPLTMTVEEAAVLIGISRSSAYDAVHRGDIPSRRIGHRILVLTEPLYDLFTASPVTTTDRPTTPLHDGLSLRATTRLASSSSSCCVEASPVRSPTSLRLRRQCGSCRC